MLDEIVSRQGSYTPCNRYNGRAGAMKASRALYGNVSSAKRGPYKEKRIRAIPDEERYCDEAKVSFKGPKIYLRCYAAAEKDYEENHNGNGIPVISREGIYKRPPVATLIKVDGKKVAVLGISHKKGCRTLHINYVTKEGELGKIITRLCRRKRTQSKQK